MKRLGFFMIVAALLGSAPAPLFAELVRITPPDEELDGFWSLAFPDKKGILIENFLERHEGEEWALDLNADGVDDFIIGAYGGNSGFDVRCQGENAVWVEPRAPNSGDINRHIIPLLEDHTVGETVDRVGYFGGDWQHTQYAGISAYIGSGSIQHPILSSGYFASNVTAYAGLRFEMGTNTHYGYVLIDEVSFFRGGGFIVEYGYESLPDTAFTLPAIIPEPGSVVMILGGASLLALYRRERMRTQKHPDDER